MVQEQSNTGRELMHRDGRLVLERTGKSSVCNTSHVNFISLPLGLALGSPIFPSGCEGKLGVALESLQGLRDLT